MKSTLALAAVFAAIAAAAPVAEDCPAPPSEGQPQDPPYFGVMSARSASPVHLLPLTARGLRFYLGGGPPSSYCPDQVSSACPPGNTTVLAGGEGTLGLGVVVPGGQQVYVAPTGELSYTQAHSAAVPEGSYVDKFKRDYPTGGYQFGHLTFEVGGLIACPAGAEMGYQVFGAVPGKTFGPECLGFQALTIASKDPGAWQY